MAGQAGVKAARARVLRMFWGWACAYRTRHTQRQRTDAANTPYQPGPRLAQDPLQGRKASRRELRVVARDVSLCAFSPGRRFAKG